MAGTTITSISSLVTTIASIVKNKKGSITIDSITLTYDEHEKAFTASVSGSPTFASIFTALNTSPSPPSWFSDLTLTSLSISYDSSKTDTKPLTFIVGASFTKNHNSYTATVTTVYATTGSQKGFTDVKGGLTVSSISSSDAFADIAGLFGISITLPKALEEALSLQSLSFNYTPSNTQADPAVTANFYITATTSIDKIVIAGAKPSATWLIFFGLEITQAVDLKNLPLVGSFINSHGGMSISDIQLVSTPAPLTAADLKAFLLPSDFPQFPTDYTQLTAGYMVTATVTADGDTHDLCLTNYSSSDYNDPGTSAPSSTDGQSTNKTFGPVTLQKYNVSYSNGDVVFDLSGWISLGGISLTLEGLSVGIPIPFDNTAPSFHLNGMGVDIQKGELTISGGFVVVSTGDYMGAVNIQAGEFGLQAYGGYAATAPSASFFIFVNAEFPIGGPPFFFVDGIAGGLGINRAYKLPTTFSQLTNYPLLPGANNPIPASDPGDMSAITKVLDNLSKYIYPEEGNYWVAAGLDVTSFEMIQLDAVLSVSFGVDLAVALMGSANMTLPVSEDPVDPLAFIAIDFEIAVDITKGIFTAMGELTPASYIYSGLAHLSGGFAFDIWFGGANEGNFVVSIGGYNPHFDKPSIYPTVPRLEIKWALGPFSLYGKAYFALTPQMMMAGLEVGAHWSGGPVKAWFNIGCDFMMGWKPFFYEADVYVHLGGSLHLLFTVTIHVGAELTIWGPDFGGKADVHFIIHFTVSFGSGAPSPPPLTWTEFKKTLPNSFPKPASSQWALSTVQPNKGLLRQGAILNAYSTSEKSPTPGTPFSESANSVSGITSNLTDNTIYNWVIDPNHFQFNILSTVPITQFAINDKLCIGYESLTESIDVPSNTYSILGYTTSEKTYHLSFADGSTYSYVTDANSFYATKNTPTNGTPVHVKKPVLVYDQSTGTQPWYTAAGTLGVAPMDILSGDFYSTMMIGFYQIGLGGVLTPVENFIAELVTKSVPQAQWSGNGQGAGNLNEPNNDGPKLLIADALIGFRITPPIWNPWHTKSINVYELVYQQNDENWNLVQITGLSQGTYSESDYTSSSNKQQLTSSTYQVTSHTTTEVLDSLTSAGFDLDIEATPSELAEITYQELPVLANIFE